MGSKAESVLIVDDAPGDLQILLENLKDDYSVRAATNGRKALEMACKEPVPDVILLDVMMPEMDGYETCRRLKEEPLTRDIDVIFVSAHDTTEEKLAGYDAGASDYLIKPVDPVELRKKVKLAISNRQNREEDMAEKRMAMETAMTAITSAGEQGVVLGFLRQSFSLSSVNELAHRIVEAVSSYDLQSTVQLRCRSGVINVGNTQPCPPLEVELLERLRDQGRIMSKGRRAIFNYGEVSLLVKNMPDDADKAGRLRDHLAILLEGADARLRSLEVNNRITEVVAESKQVLQEIHLAQQVHRETSRQIMDRMLSDLEASFLSSGWGLTEDQEKALIDLVEKGIEESERHQAKGMEVDERFQEIIASFADIAAD